MTQTGAKVLGQRFTVWYWAGHRKFPTWARSTKAMDVGLFTAMDRYKLLSDLGFTVALSWSDPIPGRTKVAAKWPYMYTNPYGGKKPPFSRENKYRGIGLPEAEIDRYNSKEQPDGAGL